MSNQNINSEESYKVKIAYQSRELSKIEQAVVMTNGAKKLDELVPEAGTNQTFVLEAINGYAVVEIHNENSRQNKDYTRLVIFTEDKACYYTGSPTFTDNFRKIYDLMADESGWGVECFKGKSTRYKDKSFLSCSLCVL